MTIDIRVFSDKKKRNAFQSIRSGEGGIRTHGSLTATRAFQARLLGHSSTSPL